MSLDQAIWEATDKAADEVEDALTPDMPEAPALSESVEAPTKDDAVDAAKDANTRHRRRRSRASTIFTSARGDTSATPTSTAVLLGD